jgi:catechol 2,3-dioxygenase-like lactoylglutathione lyase family enzyme
MLKDSEVAAVLPAKDIARARGFYRDVVGLDDPEVMDDENVFYRCGNGTTFLLYQTDNAGTAKNTQMGWMTDNLEAEVEELRGRGATFEDYDFPGLTTDNSIATLPTGKAAWFLDTEGTIRNTFPRT